MAPYPLQVLFQDNSRTLQAALSQPVPTKPEALGVERSQSWIKINLLDIQHNILIHSCWIFLNTELNKTYMQVIFHNSSMQSCGGISLSGCVFDLFLKSVYHLPQQAQSQTLLSLRPEHLGLLQLP